MDTCTNLAVSEFSLFISRHELSSRIGQSNPPLLLDVRPQARFDASPSMLAGALRCCLEDVPALAGVLFAENPNQEIVTYCVYGHRISADAAAKLRIAGLKAHALAGGFEGGEFGVDNAADIAQWRLTTLPIDAKGQK